MRSLALALLIVLTAGPALAADDVSFPRGTFTLRSTIGVASTLHDEDAAVSSLSFGGAYYVLDSLGLGLEVSGLHYAQGDSLDAGAVALSLLLRHHFVDTDDYTIYFEVSSGPQYATHATPEDGTHFNFMTRLGLGLTIPLGDATELDTGVNFMHVSNARLHGSDENPGMDAVQGYVGLIWRR